MTRYSIMVYSGNKYFCAALHWFRQNIRNKTSDNIYGVRGEIRVYIRATGCDWEMSCKPENASILQRWNWEGSNLKKCNC